MFFDSNIASIITTCTIFAAFISVVFQSYLQSQNLTRVTTIVTSLVSLEHNIEANNRVGQARVFVGFGSSSDVYLNVAEFLKNAPPDWEQITQGTTAREDSEETTNYTIRNEVDLWTCFFKYMRGEVSGR